MVKRRKLDADKSCKLDVHQELSPLFSVSQDQIGSVCHLMMKTTAEHVWRSDELALSVIWWWKPLLSMSGDQMNWLCLSSDDENHCWACLEIRWIGSVCHLMMKTTAEHVWRSDELALSVWWWKPLLCMSGDQMNWLCLSSDDENHCSNVMKCAGCKKWRTMQRKLFFARADMNTLKHCSKHFIGCQSKK